MSDETFQCRVCDQEYEGSDLSDMRNVCIYCFIDDGGEYIFPVMGKADTELGSGNIVTLAADLKTWMRVDNWQEWDMIANEGSPSIDWSLEDSEEDSFTDIDLMKLSLHRVRRALNKQGFTTEPFYVVEDIAGAVIVEFLQGIADDKDIRTLHGWHWALVNAHINQWKSEMQAKRLATVQGDVIDWAERKGIRDPYNWGSMSNIENHMRIAPRWVAVRDSGLDVDLEGCGLTDGEVKTFIGALKGDNKGLKGKPSTRRKMRSALGKIETNRPDLYKKVARLVATTRE